MSSNTAKSYDEFSTSADLRLGDISTSRQTVASLRVELDRIGMIVSPFALTLDQMNTINDLARDPHAALWEEVVEGDSGDRHTLKVGRLFKAPPGKEPTAISSHANTIAEILLQPQLHALYEGLLRKPGPFVLRRGQFNIIPAGGFVGPHIDCDADPDYELVLILHLDSYYQGGEYVVVPAGGKKSEGKVVRPFPRTLLIGRTDVNHWVERVTAGERVTLVMFLSDYAGPNRKTQ